MRLGIFSDVHGNLPALEAVLADKALPRKQQDDVGRGRERCGMSYLPAGVVSNRRFAIVPRLGRATLRVVGIGALAALVIGCQADPTPDVAMRLRTLTVPPDGTAFPPVTLRADTAVETSWIVQTDWSWRRYQQWIQDTLKAEFTTITVTATEITCKQLPPKNSYGLHFQLSGGGEAARVRVTFTAAKM